MTQAPVKTRLQTLTEEITQTYADQYTKAAALGAKDAVAMAKAISNIGIEIAAKATDRLKAEKAASDKLAETESAGKKGLETNLQDLFGPVAETVKPVFESLKTVGQAICRLDKDASGKMTVNITVGNITKVGGTGQTRSHKMTVNGKQYGTVAEAWKEVMGDVAQPTKEVNDKSATNGKRQSATRDVAVTALEKAGHTVS
ncbi:hypothetical protein LCGC14_1201470 [marine sediment metagenome]|uniref:Uncharacterized protein n=1 Tax=marine sediment metagenome TaxID=412755 RepID=A0A0F9LGQ2_9ZZZZ